MSVSSEKYLSVLEQFERKIARYDDLVNTPMRSKLKPGGFAEHKDAQKHLEALQQSGRSLKIGVIGRVKAGKSSLINALLFDGKEVLPKAATPMTAALTSIRYAPKFTAEVHFFSSEDIRDLQIKAQEYKEEVAYLIEHYKKEYSERQKQNPMRSMPPLDENILHKKAIREVSENGALAAAADICLRMEASGVDVGELGEVRVLTGDSIEDLNSELTQYVGASGKFMPFTRELVLGLPLLSLQGIEVIDTPGVNDPVKSREQRTYERLKECNAAFLVSPAGQFLSQQDFELADRLSAREGTQEIYLVASQSDMQLHSNLRDEAKGDLHVALSKLHQILTKQAISALSGTENEVLSSITADISERLIVTSGICETLLQNDGIGDDGAEHAMKLLAENYRDYFSLPESKQACLKKLSARDRLQDAVEIVRAKKVHILEQQAQTYIDAQWQTLQQVRDDVLSVLSDLHNEVKNGDKATLEARIAHLNQVSSKAIVATNSEFINQAENIQLKLPSDLERTIQKAFDILDERSESAEGQETVTYQVEKSGLGSWLARKLWGGGSEERTRSVATLNPLPIRRALEGLAKLMRSGMKDCVNGSLIQWRRELVKGMARQLRDTIGDDEVDIARLQEVCRSVVDKLVNFPDIDVPALPAELAKSSKLRGSSVREYQEAAQNYASRLEANGLAFIQSVRTSIDNIMKKNIGEELVADLIKEVKDLQEQVESKSLTLEKIKRMQAEMREL
ncbi:dynamin family protein [Vibrio metschnikovii]|uniref:dynamin family protein n=1 Tax=Vibrio metschnikovii TaxID=28172 RepID=UPI001C2FFF89|nr:dynamin family protein [Vibrio metschnikovii]